MANKNIIKIGSKVIYRGLFGMGCPEKVTIESIDWDMKNYGCFTLSNGHWCYGGQIDSLLDEEEPEEEIEVRVTFRSEVYIKGKTMEEIKDKWEVLPLFSADALDHSADICEMVTAERVDDGSYDDVIDIFD